MSRLDDAWLQTVLQRPGYHVLGEASRPQDVAAVPREPQMQRGHADVGHAVPPFPLGEGKHHPYAPYRSRTEQRYAALLADQLRAGYIERWYYEAVRLALAPRTTLTVDFLVQMKSLNDTRLELHECKGWIREDSFIKLKVAARLYPMFRFRMVQLIKGEWIYKDIPCQ